MGRLFDRIDDVLASWIERQHMYFVATAPATVQGHVNVSPKGTMETFRILGPKRVAYLDLTGSGVDTIAHLRDNGRITLMFCAFEGAPKVLRMYGQGSVVQPGSAGFASLLGNFLQTADVQVALRSIITIDITRIADSCGFVVPRMDFVEERQHLFRWAGAQQRQNGDEWREKYQQINNSVSIDDLPGLDIDSNLTDDDATRFSSKGKAL